MFAVPDGERQRANSLKLLLAPPILREKEPLPGAAQLVKPGMRHALLVAIFPANIYLYQHQEILRASPIVHLLRLPMQGGLILWAYAYTRKSPLLPDALGNGTGRRGPGERSGPVAGP